ncbi:ABC transporter substrate-binding protein [Plantibacter sp. 2H11-2]|uniref:ABC transporter substrate-binding protein n=1 Tax=Plantibacter sp. 2H11-2 TaxID=3414431 RepID=UPI003CEA6A74
MSPSIHRTRGLVLVGLLAASVMAIAGCSAPSAESSSGAAAAPDLKISAISGPNSLDPAQLVDGQQVYVWSSVYDTLLARDNKTAEVVPNAAESWEYNDSGTELTLKLRSDMTFSNGDKVDAAAVAATMLRSKDTPGIVQPKFSLVADVIAKDELTVVVSFTSYDPQFLYNLALGAGVIGDPKGFDDPALATDPVGSGPYELDVAKSVPGTTYVLTKRDDYWNSDAFAFPTVTVRVLQDPTASLNALQAGEVNAATVQAQLVKQLDTSKFTVNEIKGQALAFLDILDRGGETWPALGDKRVRQAINYAIDRENILTGIYQGVGETTQQVFSTNGAIFDKALNSTYEYDPAKGKKLVEEAGYAGETFKIPSTFLTTSIEPTLSQAFADIGLGLEWVAVPPQQAQSALQSGEFGLTFQVTGYNSDAADAFFHYGVGGYGNPRSFSDPTLAKIFDDIDSTVDPEQAAPFYKQLNEYVVDQAFEAPIVYVGTTWATTDGISMVAYGGAPATVRTFSFSS